MLPEIARYRQWLRRRSPGASTARHYASDLTLFFSAVDKDIAAVTPADVDRYVQACQDAGQATATINRRLAAVRGLYRFLQLMSPSAPENPVLPRRHFLRQGRRLPRDVADRDVSQLFAIIDQPRDRAMFLLMLRSGLRVGEVRTLDLTDLELQPRYGQLPRAWIRGKGGYQRLAFLSPHTRHALSHWLALRPAASVTEAVFPNRFGRRFSVTGIQDRLARYCAAAGLWITCHQLRHVFARHLVESGMPITSIQKLLGHARLRTTEIYLHVGDPQVAADYRRAMAAVSARLQLAGDDDA